MSSAALHSGTFSVYKRDSLVSLTSSWRLIAEFQSTSCSYFQLVNYLGLVSNPLPRIPSLRGTLWRGYRTPKGSMRNIYLFLSERQRRHQRSANSATRVHFCSSVLLRDSASCTMKVFLSSILSQISAESGNKVRHQSLKCPRNARQFLTKAVCVRVCAPYIEVTAGQCDANPLQK